MEENKIEPYQQEAGVLDYNTQAASIRQFMSIVFSWMAAALVLSGVTAWVFAHSPELMPLLIDFTAGGLSTLGYIVMFAPLGFVILMSFGYNRLSYQVLVALFLVFGVIMGMSLSFIFLVYTLGSIIQVFAAAAAMFGIMAVAGFRTNTDLTRFGSIMYMGLIGIIIASVINFFMGSAQFDYIISIIGVLVFTGLTAYDVQKLKRIGAGEGLTGDESMGKLAIMGALNLYLDFINLFLMLLRLFGGRK